MANLPSVYSRDGIAMESSAKLQADQLAVLLKIEEKYTVPDVPCLSPHRQHHKPLQHWRRKICQWSFRVIDHFHLDREVVAVGMHLLDRFLAACSLQQKDSPYCCSCPSCKRSVDSEFYQLAAMTALYLAVKLHIDNGTDGEAAHRRSFKLHAMSELSRGMFTKEHVLNMEQKMLRVLEWRVASTPTPMTFVNYYLSVLMPTWEMNRSRSDLVLHVLRELSRYLTELVVCLGEECMFEKPSQVGFAALLVAMDLLTVEALPAHVRCLIQQRVYSVCQWRDDQVIPRLQAKLGETLWPEMLLNDCADTDSSHPISLARDCGILNLMRDSRKRPKTPPKQHYPQDIEWGSSPGSVIYGVNPDVIGAYHGYSRNGYTV